MKSLTFFSLGAADASQGYTKTVNSGDDDVVDDDELYSCVDVFSWRQLGTQHKDKINNE